MSIHGPHGTGVGFRPFRAGVPWGGQGSFQTGASGCDVGGGGEPLGQRPIYIGPTGGAGGSLARRGRKSPVAPPSADESGRAPGWNSAAGGGGGTACILSDGIFFKFI